MWGATFCLGVLTKENLPNNHSYIQNPCDLDNSHLPSTIIFQQPFNTPSPCNLILVVRRRRGPLVAPFVLDLTVVPYHVVLLQVSRDINLLLVIWMMHQQLPPAILCTNQPCLLGWTYPTVCYFPKVTMVNRFQEKLTLLHISLISRR